MSQDLKGMKILVTRGADQAIQMSQLIKASGGIPLEIPLLTYEMVEALTNKKVLKQLNNFQWIFFTSANGVIFFFENLKQNNIPYPSNVKFAVVGSKTNDILQQYGFTADFMPTTFTAEEMSNAFTSYYQGGSILLVQGNLSRDVLPTYFTSINIPFTTLVVYKTKPKLSNRKRLQNVLKEEYIDVLTFTSPSCVEAFVTLSENEYKNYLNTICLCIGTTTQKRALDLGFKRVLIPSIFTIDNMIDTLIEYVNEGGKRYES